MSSKGEKVALAAVDKVKNNAVDVIDDKLELVTARKAAIKAGERMGAIRVAHRLGQFLSGEGFRGLIAFADDQDYLAYGYPTIESYLDNDPDSPMSYDQYNRRKQLIDQEGDETFGLLNSLKAPLKARKLLAGSIKVDGQEMIVGEHRVALSDQSGVVSVIKTLAKEVADKDRKLERGQKDFDRMKARAVDAEKNGGGVAALEEGILGRVLLTGGSLSLLLREVAAAPLARRREHLQIINDQQSWFQHELNALLDAEDAPAPSDFKLSPESLEDL